MAGNTRRCSCSEIFLEEWGTSGKVRPNLKTLMELLFEVKLIRAAECIASKISNGNKCRKIFHATLNVIIIFCTTLQAYF